MRAVEISMTVDGEAVRYSDVPQYYCSRCGSRLYPTPVLAAIEAAMHDRRMELPADAGSVGVGK